MLVTFSRLNHHGRLGNQLFQIAATIGTARKNDVPFLFPQWEYSSWMAVPLPQTSDQIPTECVYEEPAFCYVPIRIQAATDLLGYFQSEKYFAHSCEEIRYYLTPEKRLTEKVDALQEKYFHGIPSEKICSITVRRGDYVGLSCFFDLSKTEYYLDAMKLFGEEYFFLVFSDDIPWCREFFSRPEFLRFRFIFVEQTFPIADLFLLSRCNNHILANSTFCWWGAWLNPSPEKRVVAPQAWFDGEYTNRDQPFRLHQGFHDTRDLIPEAWKTIPAIIHPKSNPRGIL